MSTWPRIILARFAIRRIAWGASVLTGLCFAGEGVLTAATTPPRYRLLRYEEDYRYLRAASGAEDFFDPIKFVALDAGGDRFLSLGGEVRIRYEYYRNFMWGVGPQDGNGYWLRRYMVHVDTHLSDAFRTFVQLKSNLASGRTGGPRPVDEDEADLHQAFMDWRATFGSGRTLTLRVGRQEMNFGSSRLISVRNGPNVRMSFEGLRVLLEAGSWRADAFVVNPVKTEHGAFDDRADQAYEFWGLYGVHPLRAIPGANIDLYYIGRTLDSVRYARGEGRETRHTVGTRLWGRSGHWDYDCEFVYQAGRFAGDAINAWTVAIDAGHTLDDAPGRPRFGFRADIASGDRGESLGTFHPLFPRGTFYTDAGYVGRANLIDVHPNLTLRPARTVSITADWNLFWRESRADGIYSLAGTLLRPGLEAAARYIGNQPSLTVEWRPSHHWGLTCAVGYFFAGSFLTATGLARNITSASTMFSYTF
jgi:hypothetical protein